MEDESDTVHYAKLFGNCVISWKIENFCLATCEENRCITSSEFCVNGPEITRWRFTFIPKSTVIFTIERLDDSGPSSVYATWSLTIGTTDDSYHYPEFKYEFKKLAIKRLELLDLSDIMSDLLPFESDILMVNCHLVVQHMDKSIKAIKPISFGLKCLSEDLKLMLKSDQFKDVALKAEKKELWAHKAMLSLNDFLSKCTKESRDGKIILPNQNFSALAKFINYLYTGDLEIILKNPSIGMYNCLNVMNDFLLNCFFTPEELLLVTKLKVETLEHLWIISDFSSRNECLKSPFFKKPDSDTTWQLQLYPSADDALYLCVRADIVSGEIPSNVCLDFGIEDSIGEVYYPCQVLSCCGQFDSNVEKFVKRDNLINTSIVTDDTLKLMFRVRAWEGEVSSTVGSHIRFFVTEYGVSSYGFLSDRLLKLFRDGAYSDISVQACKTFYTSHKCILSARSPVFSEMIKELKESTVLTLDNITPRTLRLLLEYIYSGVLTELDRGDIILLYKAAETYNVSSLVKECQEALETTQINDSSMASTVILHDEERELQ